MKNRTLATIEALQVSFVASLLAAISSASVTELWGPGPARHRARATPLPVSSGEYDELLRDAQDALARQRAVEADVAYRLAILSRAAAAGKHTNRDMATCASALGISRQTLAPYALVGSQWTAGELKTLLAERRNVNGHPISISHLVLLARRPRAERDMWLERTFHEGLTVRDLRLRLKGA